MFIDRNIYRKPQRKAGLTGTTDGYDNYTSRLVKLVPAEVIAFYLALESIVSVMPEKNILMWVIFGLSLVGAWFYLGRMAHVSSPVQRLLTLVAFTVWVYVTGGPFATLPWYNAAYGKLALVVFTFALPLLYQGQPKTA